LRWGWVLTCTLLGFALLAAASYGEDAEWSGVVTGTLVNLGSALVFSFVLFFFENRFTRRVATTVRRVTEDAEERIAAQAAEFTSKLDDLEDRIAADAGARHEAATSAVDAVQDNLSAQSVLEALGRAGEEGVIGEAGVTVPGYEGAGDLTASFRENSKLYDGVQRPVRAHQGLNVRLGVDQKPGEIGTPVIEVEWNASKDGAQLAETLTAELRRRDRHDEARKIDWTYIFRELTRALQLAHTLTGKDATLGGQVLELVSDDWVITTAGIEQISTGRRISFTDAIPVDPSRRPRPFENVEPQAPADIDNGTWALLRKRARLHTLPSH